MCDYCETIHNEIMENGKEEEDIFYNVKEGEYYFVVEQARYERTRVKINNCPYCGRNLKNNSYLCKGVKLNIGDYIGINYKDGRFTSGKIIRIFIGKYKSLMMESRNLGFMCSLRNIETIEKLREEDYE